MKCGIHIKNRNFNVKLSPIWYDCKILGPPQDFYFAIILWYLAKLIPNFWEYKISTFTERRCQLMLKSMLYTSGLNLLFLCKQFDFMA